MCATVQSLLSFRIKAYICRAYVCVSIVRGMLAFRVAPTPKAGLMCTFVHLYRVVSGCGLHVCFHVVGTVVAALLSARVCLLAAC